MVRDKTDIEGHGGEKEIVETERIKKRERKNVETERIKERESGDREN